MKLTEALKINQAAKASGTDAPVRFTTACGFTSIHLNEFISAYVHQRFPNRSAESLTFPYGDLVSNFGKVGSDGGVTFLVIEWQDLDPRLGLRRADWRPSRAKDIIESAKSRARNLASHIRKVSEFSPIIASFPFLPVPPILPSRAGAITDFEVSLRKVILELEEQIIDLVHVHIVDLRKIDATCANCSDPKADIRYDIPYTQNFQSKLAQAMVEVAFPKERLKGLITDLDDTLWSGIIGDEGSENVSWHLDQNSHIHSIYQQFLEALGEMGILLAIASKNEVSVVEAGLSRGDLRVGGDRFFPKEIHWQKKSISVGRILDVWNISEESVAFIDDSEAEIEEVRGAFPAINTFQFPSKNQSAVLELIEELRERFGGKVGTAESRVRVASIRQNSLVAKERDEGDEEKFLCRIQSKVNIRISTEEDQRAFDLINKTNQFNLNGNRLDESEWLNLRRAEDVIIAKVDYEDKFGPLGTVSVLIGEMSSRHFIVKSWVLSCRAFSRRIEYLVIKTMFDALDVDSIQFAYVQTSKNKPITRMIHEFFKAPLVGDLVLEKADFLEHCPTVHAEAILSYDT